MTTFRVLRAIIILYSFSAVAQTTYLPLAEGNSWTLVGGAATIQLTVTSISTVSATTRAMVQFNNPWMAYGMLLRSTSEGILLEGIAYPMARYGYPDPVMLFGNGSNGQSWSSPYLTAKLVSSNNTITTPAGTYQNVRRYDITFGTNVQTWYLAPNVGFVQFGTAGAFLLSKQTLNPTPAPVTPAASACPQVGLDANPPANGDFSAAGKERALEQAIAAGARFMTVDTSWQQLEPSPYKYDFSSIVDEVGWAQKNNINAALTIKTIDTNSVTIPADLGGKAWNDPALLLRWKGLLSALAGQLNSNIKWVNLGNEVDVYLDNNPSALAPYYAFLQAGEEQLARVSPEASAGVVFSFDSYHLTDFVFRVLSPLNQHVSFTYYDGNPLAGVAQRSPSDAAFDVADMVAAAGGRPLVLTEVGYSSSSLLGSSQQLQAAFYSEAFAAFSNEGGKLTAAEFSFMSDFPPSILQSLASAYSLAGNSLWISWIGNLGLYDTVGNPKLAWQVFETDAKEFQNTLACKAGY